MFTFNGLSAAFDVRDDVEWNTIIKALRAAKFVPVIDSMIGAARETLDSPPHVLTVQMLLANPRFYYRGSNNVELLCSGEQLFLVAPSGSRFLVFELRRHDKPSRIEEVTKTIESAIRTGFDGRRVRGMNFHWREQVSPPARRVVRRSAFTDNKLQSVAATSSPTEVKQSEVLRKEVNRQFLLNLLQVGKVRAADTNQKQIAADLVTHGVVRQEYLVTCKKDSHTICSLSDISQLSASTQSSMRCAVCGRLFSDENVLEVFAPTDEGKTITTGSRWMTVWITELLKACGLRTDVIKWSAAAGEDEIDIIIDLPIQKVFFELKDREFGLGDAYPFSYRLERYGADYGIVVSMHKVSDEAKKFFQEKQQQQGGSSTPVWFLEGEAAIARDLPRFITNISEAAVVRSVSEAFDGVPLALGALVQAWTFKRK